MWYCSLDETNCVSSDFIEREGATFSIITKENTSMRFLFSPFPYCSRVKFFSMGWLSLKIQEIQFVFSSEYRNVNEWLGTRYFLSLLLLLLASTDINQDVSRRAETQEKSIDWISFARCCFLRDIDRRFRWCIFLFFLNQRMNARSTKMNRRKKHWRSRICCNGFASAFISKAVREKQAIDVCRFSMTTRNYSRSGFCKTSTLASVQQWNVLWKKVRRCALEILPS